jgi:hypothetical protein
MMRKYIALCLLIIISTASKANEGHAPIGEKKADEVKDELKNKDDLIDFSSIKDIIKKDGLDVELKKKTEEKRKLLDEKKRIELRKYNIPTEDVFWSMFSELWLIKNATKLKWDFHKPDFELEKTFAQFLETQGLFEKKFKILLLDTPDIAHAALPSNSDEYIFLISLPFIRTLDLSKVEISLILFEDLVRLRKGYFKAYVTSKELENYLGTNFSGKTLDKKLLDDHLKKYNSVLFEKGFNFQEQFETTKEMDTLLKNDLKIWNTYLTMLSKIDELVKSNSLYKSYNSIYPSPELQLNWLKPKTPSL